MKENYLNRISKKHLMEFLTLYAEVRNIDVDSFYLKAQDLFNFYNKKVDSNDIINSLETQWYKSLREDNNPDYSVYDSEEFVLDLWACWKLYSRNYIRLIYKNIDLYEHLYSRVRSIVDLGCGIGYSTKALIEVFECQVYGTNLKSSVQWDICQRQGLKMYEDIADIKSGIDMIFASEYFEHFSDPIEHLNHIIKNCNPQFIIMANAFGADAIGHFDEYPVGDKKVEGRLFGRHFNKYLKIEGYEPMVTGFFNNRPVIFKRNDVR